MYKDPKRRDKALRGAREAAKRLTSNILLGERGLLYLARLLCYFRDPTSPCRWRRQIQATNPGMQVRPWHLSDTVIRYASYEMDQLDWWPSEDILPTPEELELRQEEARWQQEITCEEVVDLAALSGTSFRERRGMSREETRQLLAWISSDVPKGEFPEVKVGVMAVVPRRADYGYQILFSVSGYADVEFRLYSVEHWNILCRCARALGTFTGEAFLSRLTLALRQSQAEEQERKIPA